MRSCPALARRVRVRAAILQDLEWDDRLGPGLTDEEQLEGILEMYQTRPGTLTRLPEC